jgi:hypothetical protein
LWIRINKDEGTPTTVLFVPEILHEKIVQEAHGQLLTGHDIAKTRERIKESYYWPNIDADAAKHIAACQKCQKRKNDRPQLTLLSLLKLLLKLNKITIAKRTPPENLKAEKEKIYKLKPLG